MWKCPKCKREFKRKGQQHSCTLITKESLFAKRPPELKKLYDLVVREVKQFGRYREETVKPDVIFFKTKSSFLGINVPPVVKYLQTSKHRVVHLVPVDQPGDIDEQLVSWMKRSYELIARPAEKF